MEFRRVLFRSVDKLIIAHQTEVLKIDARYKMQGAGAPTEVGRET